MGKGESLDGERGRRKKDKEPVKVDQEGTRGGGRETGGKKKTRARWESNQVGSRRKGTTRRKWRRRRKEEGGRGRGWERPGGTARKEEREEEEFELRGVHTSWALEEHGSSRGASSGFTIKGSTVGRSIGPHSAIVFRRN